MANTGQFYRMTEDYVNEICQAFITPHEDFETIICTHTGTSGTAFIKLTDATDTAVYFDITAKSPADICRLLSRVIVGEETPEMILDYEKRKEVAQLFK